MSPVEQRIALELGAAIMRSIAAEQTVADLNARLAEALAREDASKAGQKTPGKGE